MPKYLDIFTDYGFKKIFGEEASKGILIDFLNALLPDKGNIKDITFKNTEKLGPFPINRNVVYDIYCENDRGEKFIVELQKVKQKYYLDRTVLYSTYAIIEDAQKGDWEWILKPVYCISLLDFRLVDYINGAEDTKVIQKVTLKNEEGLEIYHKLTYVYLELPNFNKTDRELETRLDKWLFFIKKLETFDAIPEIFKNEVVFMEAFHKAELAMMSDEDMAKYNQSLKTYRDSIANINTAKEDGLNKGIEIGMDKGIEIGMDKGIEIGMDKGIEIGEANKEKFAQEKEKQAKTEIARNCLKNGLTIAMAATLTGLTEGEIKAMTL